MRLIRLNTVVLPAPFGPMTVNTSPFSTAKLTPSTARTPPKRRDRFSALNIAHRRAVRIWKLLLALEGARR
jgi:hypothetical protein